MFQRVKQYQISKPPILKLSIKLSLLLYTTVSFAIVVYFNHYTLFCLLLRTFSFINLVFDP